jgi:hypothetical protein
MSTTERTFLPNSSQDLCFCMVVSSRFPRDFLESQRPRRFLPNYSSRAPLVVPSRFPRGFLESQRRRSFLPNDFSHWTLLAPSRSHRGVSESQQRRGFLPNYFSRTLLGPSRFPRGFPLKSQRPRGFLPNSTREMPVCIERAREKRFLIRILKALLKKDVLLLWMMDDGDGDRDYGHPPKYLDPPVYMYCISTM